MNEVLRSTPRPVLVFPRPTVISGSSMWVRTLHAATRQGLVRLGPSVNFAPVRSLAEDLLPNGVDVVYVSNLTPTTPDLSLRAGRARRVLRRLGARGHKVTAFPWELYASALFAGATSGPPETAAAAKIADWLGAFLPDGAGITGPVRDGDVELNNNLAPTPRGMLETIRAVGGGHRLESWPVDALTRT